MQKKLYILILILFITGHTDEVFSNNKVAESDSPYFCGISYTGDFVRNFRGGIKKGTTYLGLAYINAGFDTEKANFWKGGELLVNLGNTHGGEPSANLVGDFQVVSNIEAEAMTFLYELWYKQSIHEFSLTLGFQDLNASYVVSEYGGFFLNSSFGIHSIFADNIPTPTFPLTALGVNLQWGISTNYRLQFAAFNGLPGDFEINKHNSRWKLNKNEGVLLITELQVLQSLVSGKTGCYKAGTFYHEHRTEADFPFDNYGFYLVADQEIYKEPNGKGGMALFAQIGLSPKDKNENNHYFGFGAVYKGLVNRRPDDELGIAFASARFKNSTLENETVLEFGYQAQLTENIYIKPDFQYVINPAGTDQKLEDAMVGFIRLGIEF